MDSAIVFFPYVSEEGFYDVPRLLMLLGIILGVKFLVNPFVAIRVCGTT